MFLCTCVAFLFFSSLGLDLCRAPCGVLCIAFVRYMFILLSSSEALTHLWSELIVTTHPFKRFQFCCRLKQQPFKIVSLCFSCGYLAALQHALHIRRLLLLFIWTVRDSECFIQQIMKCCQELGYKNVQALSRLCRQGALTNWSSSICRQQGAEVIFPRCHETSNAGSICWRHLIWNVGCKFITS